MTEDHTEHGKRDTHNHTLPISGSCFFREGAISALDGAIMRASILIAASSSIAYSVFVEVVRL